MRYTPTARKWSAGGSRTGRHLFGHLRESLALLDGLHQLSADREELRRKTGSEEIPTLLLEDGTAISGADEIIEYLEANHHERADAEEHRERAEAHS